MGESSWQWSIVGDHGPALLEGAVVTILLTLIVLGIGGLVGLAMGTIRTRRARSLRAVGAAIDTYVWIFNGLPVLVVLLLVYLAVPGSAGWLNEMLIGVEQAAVPHAGGTEAGVLGAVAAPSFAAATIALSLWLSARLACIVRRGLESTPGSVIDAYRAQGMGGFMLVRHAIIPEAFRRSLPELISATTTTILLTTLAAFIGCAELLHVAYTAGLQSGHPAELLTVAALFYLVVIAPLATLQTCLRRSRWLRDVQQVIT